MLELFVEKIYIYDDKIVVNFFDSSDNKEVGFEKMQQIFAAEKQIEDIMNVKGIKTGIFSKINNLICVK